MWFKEFGPYSFTNQQRQSRPIALTQKVRQSLQSEQRSFSFSAGSKGNASYRVLNTTVSNRTCDMNAQLMSFKKQTGPLGNRGNVAETSKQDSMSLNLQKQATVLNLKTADGDTVMINLRIKDISYTSTQSERVFRQNPVDQLSKNQASTEVSISQKQNELSGSVCGEALANVKQLISASTASMMQSSFNEETPCSSTSLNFQTFKSESMNFEFELIGNLDSDELKAIGDLVNQIDDLGVRFFEGNASKAYSMAKELKFDSSAIAQFALEFHAKQSNYVEQTYVESKELPQLPDSLLRPISEYAKAFEDMDAFAKKLLEKNSLVRLMEKVLHHDSVTQIAHRKDSEDDLDELNTTLENKRTK